MPIIYTRNEKGEFAPIPTIVGPRGEKGERGAAGDMPRNYLINSNFVNPVNQRNQKTYGGTVGYKIDMWRSQPVLSWSVAKGGGLTLTNTGAQNANGMAQYMVKGEEPEAGRMVTLACEDVDGNVFCGAIEMPSSGNKRAFSAYDGDFYGLVYARTESAGARVQLMLRVGKSVSLKWAALYDGEYTPETLPPYTARTFTQELLECQRWFIKYYSFGVAGSTKNADGRVEVSMPSPVAMDNAFSWTTDGSVTVVCDGVEYPAEITAVRTPMSVDGYNRTPTGTMLSLILECSGDVMPEANKVVYVRMPAIEFSCESEREKG